MFRYKYIGYILFIGFLYFIVQWKSPSCNLFSTLSIHDSVHAYGEKKYVYPLEKIEGNFIVYFMENTHKTSINPYFPAIHIQTTVPHNAWIHVVYADAKDVKWRTFLDAPPKNISHSSYPFYTCKKDFYDAPLWRYGIFSKPLRYWKGHAFAVNIDYKEKKIHCLGGIQWGFKLSFLALRPKGIFPSPLNKKHWTKAWKIIKEKFLGYEQIYGYIN